MAGEEEIKPIELDPNITDEEAIEKLAEIVDEGGEGGSGEGESGEGGSGEGGGNAIPLDEEELEVFKSVYGEVGEDFFKDGENPITSKKDALTKAFAAVIEKNKTEVFNDDPFIKNYIEAKSKDGFDVNSYIESLSAQKGIDEMDNETFLRERLKTSGNYSEEDINDFISKKTKIEIDNIANGEKQRYKQEIAQKQENIYHQNLAKINEDIEAQNKNVDLAVTKYVNEKIKAGKFPLKFSDEILKEVEDGIKDSLMYELVKMPDGTVMATQKLFNDLRNNDILEQVAPFIALAKKGKLGDYLTNYMSSIKDKEFNKIKEQPGIGTGSSESSFNADSFFNQ